ncbi:MAG: biliverdin-producing heme oxygenase [Gammaproteobacteria bacterium]|nr:biliverdin-producing heme oxygenase [Gammaproteobacteria bacterium]
MSHELLSALRESTHALHQELDHHPMMALLLKPELTAPAYANTLAWLHPLQTILEGHLAKLLPSYASHIELASRVAALDDDLKQLNTSPYQLATDIQLDIQRTLTPSLGTVAGMLYVLNGARLGSAHIARRIQHISPTLPIRYFAEANGAVYWPLTLKLIDNLEKSEYSDCKVTAEAVFRWYIKVMDSAQQDAVCQTVCGYT